ncbi:MAG TPA: hypothetical protein EYN69_11000 [Flavobacteriales bacterium]|nr:hypothetical protein [Flavobacteriales bacterium]
MNFSYSKMIFLGLISVLVVVFFLMLSFHFRIASDDFHITLLIREHDLLSFLKLPYLEWSGRWASFMLRYFVFSLPESFSGYNITTLLYYTANYSLFTFSIYLLITNTLTKFFVLTTRKIIILCYAFIFLLSFFFITFYANESWFWITGSANYLQGIILSCLGMALILDKKINFPYLIIIGISFLYIGGAAEPYSFVLIVSMLSILAYHKFYEKQTLTNLMNSPFIRKMSVALICILISSGLNFMAPGNWERKKTINKTENSAIFEKGMSTNMWSEAKRFATSIPKKRALCFLIFSLCWIQFGYSLRKFRNDFSISLQSPVKKITLLFLLAVFISMLPTVLAFGNLGPVRTWTHISFFLTVYASCLCCYAGYKLNISEKLATSGFYLNSLGCIAILIIFISYQYPRVSAYSEAVDQRIDYLKTLNNKGQKETVALTPLPKSGFLTSAEIQGDQNGLRNQSLKRLLELNFDIKKNEQ